MDVHSVHPKVLKLDFSFVGSEWTTYWRDHILSRLFQTIISAPLMGMEAKVLWPIHDFLLMRRNGRPVNAVGR